MEESKVSHQASPSPAYIIANRRHPGVSGALSAEVTKDIHQ